MKTKTFIGSCVLFLFLLATLVNAQTSPPELIFYQGIARDASGNPLVNQPIGIQLKIHQGAFNGPVVFTETHAVTTNSLGLFSLQIGSTNSTAFQLILWNNGPYFLEVLMDPNGGSAYTSIGTQQLLSVPYALYSKSSYSSAIAFGSYTTQNAPPISISSNTSATSTTLTLTQGSNTSSVQIDFPAPPSPSISITSASPSIVSVFPPSGNAFTISATPPSFTSSNGITNITGTYPNYTVTTTPSLSISGYTLSISGGNTVTLPTPTIIGQGIASITPVSGNSFTIDVPSPTLNIIQSTPGQATFSLSQGTSSTSQTLTFPPSSVTLYGSGIASVSPNGSPSSTFTVNVPSPTLSANSLPTGVTTITINQGSATNTTSFNILPAIQNNAWGVNGNTVTSSNYLGTNNSADLIFKTNNTERMRISPTGEVGIWSNASPGQLLDIGPSTHALTTRITNILSNGIALYINNTHTANTNPVFHSKHSNSSGTNALFEGGKVGVGPFGFSPQAYLHVQRPSIGSIPSFQIGNNNQPFREWIFDVDGTANLKIKNENTSSPYLCLNPDSTGIIGVNTYSSIGFADFVVSYNSSHSTGYAGMYVNAANAGKPFYGYAQGNNPIAWTYIDGSDGNKWKLYYGGDRITVTPSGVVGIGTNTPTAQLHIATTFTDALQIDNGHIKATGSVVTASILTNSCSSCSTFVPINPSSFTVIGNDVRGVLSLSAFTLNPNNFYENNFKVDFAKSYTNSPHIILTVSGDIPPSLSIIAYVTEVNSSYFKIRIRTYMGGLMSSVTISDLKIYYFVIE